MSSVNIKRAVENIRAGTSVYTPLVEVIVNAIQAIEAKDENEGKISIVVNRDKQLEIKEKSSVIGFEIKDNGIGFTDENRESFDTLYSDQKLKEGGKGFGRFICLKYFEDFTVESCYKSEDGYKKRSFRMGKQHDIIENEIISDSDSNMTGSTILLSPVKNGSFPDKRLKTIARNLVEKLLPYFISDGYICPRISIAEKDDSDFIVLNDFVNNELSAVIKEIGVSDSFFTLNGLKNSFDFSVRVFKFYSPKNQNSKISLVANQREVTDTAIHNYIPEFVDEFYDKITIEEKSSYKNYIIKAYVFSDYLDAHVSLERGGFEFDKDIDLFRGISQNDIEKAASVIAKSAVGDEITTRQEKKKDQVDSYVEDQAPWHRATLQNFDYTSMPYKPSDEEIESRLHKEKFNQEVLIKKDVNKLLAETNLDKLKADVTGIVDRVSVSGKNELVHYISLRKNILEIFKKSLESDSEGKYSSEGIVHDIIFPRKGDSERTSFENHNLWIIDERLNFTNYVSSDLPLNGGLSDRPDLLVYGKRVLFRGENEPSNPISIFEFKKPQRDDFANPSSSEDPVQQIVRYVNSIRDGEFKTPQGVRIFVSESTTFYGYVICDLTPKVENWLRREKFFTEMPDRMGWYNWHSSINLYVEVLSWQKVLKDANMRSKIFFHKLGI